jgi:hypothetical protein
MNKKLADLRKKFRGQKGKVGTGFDNSPLSVGKKTARIVKSSITDDMRWKRHLKIEGGDEAGRYCFPYAPYLSEEDGVLQTARDLRAILGEVVPGEKRADGELEVDFGEFLTVTEDLINQCEDEPVEITVCNQKPKPDGSHLRDDGTPWQNVYINRGLGDDAKGATTEESDSTKDTRTEDNLGVGPKKKKAPRKKAVKKTVKKTARK